MYRFYPVADRQALATLEFALRERLPNQRASSHVSDDAMRKIIESGAERIDFDPDNAVPEPQD